MRPINHVATPTSTAVSKPLLYDPNRMQIEIRSPKLAIEPSFNASLGVSMVPPQPRQSGNQRQMNTSQPASCKLITVGLFRPAGLTFDLISSVSIATGFSVIASLVSQLDLQRSRSDRPHYSLPKITRLNVKRSDYRLQILNASNPIPSHIFW